MLRDGRCDIARDPSEVKGLRDDPVEVVDRTIFAQSAWGRFPMGIGHNRRYRLDVRICAAA